MLQIDNYLYASDLAEAYGTLHSVPGSAVLGGCGYLRLGTRKISTAIDLSRLDLDFIRETDHVVEIGAMTSLRSIETNPSTSSLWSGVLTSALQNIVGVQLRACVTIGGTVAGRYPFSDPLTALMALEPKLVFHEHGQVLLEEYLQGKGYRDVLEKIIIPKDGRLAAFSSVRKVKSDYAVLNVAVARKNKGYRVVVGCRPGRALHVPAAASYLDRHGLDAETAVEAGRIAADNLQFGDNPRGSGEYRKAVCPVLVKRALTEVIHAS